MNNCTFSGNLGGNVELKNINGHQLAEFSIAVNTGWGERKKTMWVKVKVWGKQAEPCSKFLSKGKKAEVAGRFSQETWTGKDGKEMTSNILEAVDVEFPPRDRDEQAQPQADQKHNESPVLDDIPF